MSSLNDIKAGIEALKEKKHFLLNLATLQPSSPIHFPKHIRLTPALDETARQLTGNYNQLRQMINRLFRGATEAKTSGQRKQLVRDLDTILGGQFESSKISFNEFSGIIQNLLPNLEQADFEDAIRLIRAFETILKMDLKQCMLLVERIVNLIETHGSAALPRDLSLSLMQRLSNTIEFISTSLNVYDNLVQHLNGHSMINSRTSLALSSSNLSQDETTPRIYQGSNDTGTMIFRPSSSDFYATTIINPRNQIASSSASAVPSLSTDSLEANSPRSVDDYATMLVKRQQDFRKSRNERLSQCGSFIINSTPLRSVSLNETSQIVSSLKLDLSSINLTQESNLDSDEEDFIKTSRENGESFDLSPGYIETPRLLVSDLLNEVISADPEVLSGTFNSKIDWIDALTKVEGESLDLSGIHFDNYSRIEIIQLLSHLPPRISSVTMGSIVNLSDSDLGMIAGRLPLTVSEVNLTGDVDEEQFNQSYQQTIQARREAFPRSYTKLFQSDDPFTNAVALLTDYTKNNSKFMVRMHGHFHRHHFAGVVDLVNRTRLHDAAPRKIKEIDELLTELKKLEPEKEGKSSLAMRIAFIEDQLSASRRTAQLGFSI